MRAYRLHDSSWTRIVTHRTRRPSALAARLKSRRRREFPIPIDGNLVLIDADHACDPRTGQPVDRRELLDRLVEALSIAEVDGVVASADVLEELTLLNVLEHRLAVCGVRAAGPAEGSIPADPAGLRRANFDAVRITTTGADRVALAAALGELQRFGLPALVELVAGDGGRPDYDVEWCEWVGPLRSVATVAPTGPGVWFSLPAVAGLHALADHAGFPILVRDTEVPIDPGAWQALFDQDPPLTVRGIIAGPSVLFPIAGSVAEAAQTIAAACRPSRSA